MAWTPFYNPMPMSSATVLWLVLPLCASVAMVYKTVRTKDVRRLPWEVLWLFVYMVVGLIVLGVGLWLLMKYWP
ncbi:MAG TPA: hypothetical protein VNA25_25005 [Phycisphaerae bacterium]|nr:hypothetical protein [Phycisphaerae bacterium]